MRLILVGMALLAAGCAPAITPALQQQAVPAPAFAELAAHPEQHRGQLVILGGEVMSVEPWGERGSLLTVDQRALSEHLFPIGPSGGTFQVESDGWLNSGTYQPKSRVAVAGVVVGGQNGVLRLHGRQITYLAPPVWEKYYYPIPREWYPPELEYWYTPPYYNPYIGGGRR